jgi:3-dehydroquinate dehydratase-1
MTAESGAGSVIQIVASLSSRDQLTSALLHEADAVELRIDLMPDLPVEMVDELVSDYKGPVILTLRSMEEGGAFSGDVSQWRERVLPYLSLVTMVDVEMRYREHAPWLKDLGVTVIASHHTNEMLSYEDLSGLYHDLRSFGNIPKIAVHPENTADILSLLQFTNIAGKPLIVSVTGTVCRYARPLLPIFGSLYTYCYLDTPTSPGQYSLEEMRILSRLLSPGIIDTWFEGPGMHS